MLFKNYIHLNWLFSWHCCRPCWAKSWTITIIIVFEFVTKQSHFLDFFSKNSQNQYDNIWLPLHNIGYQRIWPLLWSEKRSRWPSQTRTCSVFCTLSGKTSYFRPNPEWMDFNLAESYSTNLHNGCPFTDIRVMNANYLHILIKSTQEILLLQIDTRNHHPLSNKLIHYRN